MKKITTACLCLLLLVAMAVTAFAAGAASFTLAPSSNMLERGDTVNVTVNVSCSDPVTTYAAVLNYDSNVFELVGGEAAASGTSIAGLMGNGLTVGWTNATTYSGSIGYFTLKVKDDAALDSTTITATTSAKNSKTGEALGTNQPSTSITIACDHDWDNGVVESKPTCTVAGKTIYTCDKCGTEDERTTNPLNHNYGEWIKASETQHKRTCDNDATHIEYANHTGGTATCVAKAECTVCNEEYGNINAANHVGGTKLVGKVDATCSKDGYTGDTHCNSCNVKIKDGDPITATGAHKDADGKWESNGNNHWHTCSCTAKFDEAAHAGGTATCNAKAKCATCGKDHGALNPQKHTGGTEIRDAVTATCSKDGYTGDTYCKSCDVMIEKGEVIKANGEHVYTDWTKVDDKDHKGTCGCGATKTEAHKWNDGVITTQATCAKDGVKTFTCSICAGTKTETIKATGEHVYTNWTKVDDKGHKGTCGCGATTTEAHKWDAGKVTTDATCGKDGVKTFGCSICKGTKTEAIKATGKHDYTKSYKDNGDGTHSALCACGAAEAEKHDFSVEGPITVKPSTSNAGKQDILCVCGAKTVKTLPQLPADLDDVPKTGDVTIQITMGIAAMISMAAAAAFVFKRKIAK